MRHKLALILWKCFSLNILSSFNRLQAASWQHNQATLKKQIFFYCLLLVAEQQKGRRRGRQRYDAAPHKALLCALEGAGRGGGGGVLVGEVCTRV